MGRETRGYMWKLIDPKERNLIIEGVIQIGRLNKVYKNS